VIVVAGFFAAVILFRRVRHERRSRMFLRPKGLPISEEYGEEPKSPALRYPDPDNSSYAANLSTDVGGPNRVPTEPVQNTGALDDIIEEH
jgi:hypothetical protein